MYDHETHKKNLGICGSIFQCIPALRNRKTRVNTAVFDPSTLLLPKKRIIEPGTHVRKTQKSEHFWITFSRIPVLRNRKKRVITAVLTPHLPPARKTKYTI